MGRFLVSDHEYKFLCTLKEYYVTDLLKFWYATYCFLKCPISTIDIKCITNLTDKSALKIPGSIYKIAGIYEADELDIHKH